MAAAVDDVKAMTTPHPDGPSPTATPWSRIITVPGPGLGFFLQKAEGPHGFPCGRRNIARECGTCDRPGRQGLKGGDDGSSQHDVDVSSASVRCLSRQRTLALPPLCPACTGAFEAPDLTNDRAAGGRLSAGGYGTGP